MLKENQLTAKTKAFSIASILMTGGRGRVQLWLEWGSRMRSRVPPFVIAAHDLLIYAFSPLNGFPFGALKIPQDDVLSFGRWTLLHETDWQELRVSLRRGKINDGDKGQRDNAACCNHQAPVFARPGYHT